MGRRLVVYVSVVVATQFAVPSATPDVRLGSTTPGGEVGSAFRDCPHCPELLPVRPGSVTLRASSSDATSETLPHPVTLTRRFAYGQAKVSSRDWKQCVLAGHCQSLGAMSSASLDPVAQVSWVEVQQYLTWLSLETGVEYRLLSEAEWEYLAAMSAPGFRADGLEWVSDCWHPDYSGAPADGSSWDRDGDCRYHVARGRRAGETVPVVRRRYRVLFSARDPALGFRVARTLGGVAP